MRELRFPIIAGVMMIFILGIVSVSGILKNDAQMKLLEVTFLDVGQGDATFIESPTGTQVLIDGGKGSVVLRKLEKVMGYFDRTIDVIVATHPDLDHVEGLIDVLHRYEVGMVLLTENESDSSAYRAFLEAVDVEGSKVMYARKGQVFDLGRGDAGSTTLRILFPDRDPSKLESNMSSIVARLTYGESEYLLTGDSPQEIEEYLVNNGTLLRSDVLKAGHHGSRTSSSEIFIQAVQPRYGIFSAGKDNSYGHPHTEVVDIFTSHNVTLKNTADLGSIFSESDGKIILFK